MRVVYTDTGDLDPQRVGKRKSRPRLSWGSGCHRRDGRSEAVSGHGRLHRLFECWPGRLYLKWWRETPFEKWRGPVTQGG